MPQVQRPWGGRECGVLGVEKVQCLECGGLSRAGMGLEGERGEALETL